MGKKLILFIIAATAGLWLASLFVSGVAIELLPESNFFGVELNALWQIFLLLGITLGLLHFFVKPVLNVITLPLRILSLGLFSFVVEAAIIWAVDVIFEEFSAPLTWPLLLTTLIIWGLHVVASMINGRAD